MSLRVGVAGGARHLLRSAPSPISTEYVVQGPDRKASVSL